MPGSCCVTIFIVQCFTLETQFQIECDDDAVCLFERRHTNTMLKSKIQFLHLWRSSKCHLFCLLSRTVEPIYCMLILCNITAVFHHPTIVYRAEKRVENYTYSHRFINYGACVFSFHASSTGRLLLRMMCWAGGFKLFFKLAIFSEGCVCCFIYRLSFKDFNGYVTIEGRVSVFKRLQQVLYLQENNFSLHRRLNELSSFPNIYLVSPNLIIATRTSSVIKQIPAQSPLPLKFSSFCLCKFIILIPFQLIEPLSRHK